MKKTTSPAKSMTCWSCRCRRPLRRRKTAWLRRLIRHRRRSLPPLRTKRRKGPKKLPRTPTCEPRAKNEKAMPSCLWFSKSWWGEIGPLQPPLSNPVHPAVKDNPLKVIPSYHAPRCKQKGSTDLRQVGTISGSRRREHALQDRPGSGSPFKFNQTVNGLGPIRGGACSATARAAVSPGRRRRRATTQNPSEDG